MSSPETPPRRLRRSARERMLSGTAGGIAEFFALDPSLVRLGFAVLALFGGAGIALYAVCALILPAEEGAPPLSTTRKAVLACLLLVGVLSFPFVGLGVAFVGPGVLVLLALGVLVWRAVGGTPDARLFRAAVLVVGTCAAVVVGLVAGALTALGGGVAVAGAVIVAGLALVVGGFLGAGRWLIVPALLLATPVAVVAAADIEFKGGVGEREYRPASVLDLRDTYRLGAGRLTLDLRGLDLVSTTTTAIRARVGTGRLEVIAPADACVRTTAHTGVGHIDLGRGRGNDGVDVDAQDRPDNDGRGGSLDLDLQVGMGEIVVDGNPAACRPR